jgi:tetratricopeptide (TPR) repeat protein
MRSTLSALAFAATTLLVAAGCGEPREPFTVVSQAREDRQRRHYSEALEKYLWALDHPSDSFFPKGYVDEICSLPTAAAAAALERRWGEIRKEMLRCQGPGSEKSLTDATCPINTKRLELYVAIGFTLERVPQLIDDYSRVRSSFSERSALRREFWNDLEDRFVAAKDYPDALLDRGEGLETLRHYERALEGTKDEPPYSFATATAAKLKGASHFEALVGGGDEAAAKALFEEVLRFSPRQETAVELVRRAARATSPERAASYQTAALSIVPSLSVAALEAAIRDGALDAKKSASSSSHSVRCGEP